MARHEARALWALAAGELTPDERLRVEAHLAACEACAEELARVKQTREHVQQARAVEPEVDWDAVGAGLRSAAAQRLAKAEPRPRWPWAVALAGACAAMLALWMVMPREVASGSTGDAAALARVTETRAGSPAHGDVPEKAEALATTQTQGAGTGKAEALAATQAQGAEPREVEGAQAAAQAQAKVRRGAAGAQAQDEAGRTAEGAQAAAQAQSKVRREAGGAHAQDTAARTTEGAEALATTQAAGAASVVLRETGGMERKLEPGMRLRSGVAVKTPPRASAVLRLPDASRVRLSSGSEVELSRAEERQVHLTVKQGRLSVEASHAERQGFLVEAAGLRVSVVGTVFTVERTEAGAAVAVAEGKVRVEVDGQPPRLVGAGERVELHSEARTLTQQPLSPPDRQAFKELQAPASPPPGKTVPTGANVADARNNVVPAVARAPQTPATVKPAVGTPGATKTDTAQVVAAAVRTRPEQTPSPAGALAGTEPVKAPAPAAVASAVKPPGDPSQEFAPYPAASVADSLPPPGTKPPEPPEELAERPEPKKKREPLIPMALASKDADERFLGYARLQLSPRTCESFLSSLQEIAQRSPRADHREQARYLRARCYEEKLQPQAAEGEYRQYLNEFPRGRYAREARTALLP